MAAKTLATRILHGPPHLSFEKRVELGLDQTSHRSSFTDIDLMDSAHVMHLTPHFKTAAPIDEVLMDVKTMLPGDSIIANIQPTYEGNGTHWVCLLRRPEGNSRGRASFEYFDPLGLGAYVPSGISELVRRSGSNPERDIQVNTRRIQSISSQECGLDCLRYLWDRKQAVAHSSL